MGEPISVERLIDFLRSVKPEGSCSISYGLAQVFIAHLRTLTSPEHRELERQTIAFAAFIDGEGPDTFSRAALHVAAIEYGRVAGRTG